MSNIAPNTNIYLCSGVPVDNTYNHALYFPTLIAQHTYFESKVLRTFLANTYQRVGRNKMRLAVVADQILTCNYMFFQNTAFGTKWFYAFITDIEYINNATSEITYEIDVLQTWQNEYTLRACMVLREHSLTDNIGDNIIPEPVSCGEYVFNTWDLLVSGNPYVIIAINRLGENQTVDGKNYGNVYGACALYGFDLRDANAVNTLIAEYAASPDSVVSIYMCPSFIAAANGFTEVGIAHTYAGGFIREGSITGLQTGATAIPTNASCNGYVPRNKKLFTYPYTFFSIVNSNGESLNTRYEFFRNGTPVFQYGGSQVQPVQVDMYPVNYKGSSGVNTSEKISLTGYPACSWNTDYYAAWLAQTAVPGVVNAGANIGAAFAGGGMTAGPIGGLASAGLSAMKEAASAVSAHYSASIHADITKGNIQCGSSAMSMGLLSLYAGRVSVNAQSAREIDDFFTIYGYAVNARKIPSITNRPHWNYIKTSGCIIEGRIPFDDESKIISIFDNGVTWWKNPSEVGAYWLDNSPA